MNNFEKELKSALARREPPAGFSDRVMAAAGRPGANRYRSWTAAAAVLVLLFASLIERERKQRMDARAAGEELARAMEIVTAKLDSARQRVVKMGDSQ